MVRNLNREVNMVPQCRVPRDGITVCALGNSSVGHKVHFYLGKKKKKKEDVGELCCEHTRWSSQIKSVYLHHSDAGWLVQKVNSFHLRP